MKVAEVQKSTTAKNTIQKKRQPFFNKGGEGSFFSKSSEATTPFFTPTVQPKLKVGKPNDKYEVEADAMADKVVQKLSQPKDSSPSHSDTSVQAKHTPVGREHLQKKEDDEVSEHDNELQLKPIFESNAEQPPEADVQTKLSTPTVQKDTSQEEKLQKKEEEQISESDKEVQRKPIFESNAEQPEANLQAKFINIPTIQRALSSGEEEQIQEKENVGEGESEIQTKTEIADSGRLGEEEDSIQTKSENTSQEATSDLQNRLNSSKGGGSPLSIDTQNDMGSAFGADFSKVRVHTGSESIQMNKELGAQAFTHGNDIHFNEGKYNTNSDSGKHLLAHELTHTVQQGAAIRTKKENISDTNQPVIQRKSWARRKIESGLNWAAERAIPGYTLLNVILGKNLITDETVARTGVNLIEGFMDLTPIIGKILFNELKETNTLKEAGTWVEQQIAKFGIDFNDISRRLKAMWDEMSVWKGISGNIKVFKKYFGGLVGKIMAFTRVVSEKVKELRFEGALRLVGAHDLLTTLKKNKVAFKRAIDNPKEILSGFMTSLKQGFSNFKNNFGIHFKNALFGWLFGKAAEIGVEIPQKFDIPNLFGFIAQLVGATYQQIRMQVVKKLGPKGEKIIGYMEKTASVVKDLVIKGPIALWEMVKNSLANLKTMIFTQITKLVSTEIIKQAVIKLVSMLNPAGAIVQLVLGIYRVIKFFIDWWETIKDIATGILGSIVKVALGQSKGATSFIEKIMAKGMQLVIAFLANIFGLGGIVGKVKNLIKRIAKPVKTAIGKVINWIVNKGKALFGKLFGKGKEKTVDVEGNDEKKHKLIGQQVRKKLQEPISKKNASFTEFYKQKQKQAKDLIKEYQPQLKDGIKIDITSGSLSEEKKNNDIDFKIRIAPNDFISEIKAKHGTAGVLALYRGIHYYALYDDKAEKEKVINNVAAEQDFSNAVFDILGKDRFSEDVTYEEKLAAAKIVVEELMAKKTKVDVKTWWGSRKTVSSHFYALLQRFVNSRATFIKEIKERKRDSYKGFSFTSLPFISTTKTASRSAAYAMNEVSPKEDQIEKFEDFDSTLLVGKLFVYLFKVDDLEALKAEDIRALKDSGKIYPHARFSKADKEITFPGFIPKENKVDTINATAGDSVSGLAAKGEKAAKNKAVEDIIPWSK
ncbi:eCIS core domain-containing protein [Aquimarina longa]|uniref:eCIS core domain-containing protein n=1 Tax=Aquimarina longa TaxID=1080221 RepID=UPI000786010D|nr:DUF4157 domain-containing protein [Aquimarina longa]